MLQFSSAFYCGDVIEDDWQFDWQFTGSEKKGLEKQELLFCQKIDIKRPLERKLDKYLDKNNY